MSEAMRCAECDCENGGAECTWFKTPTPLDMIRAAVTDYWGERCGDYAPSCDCCRVWAYMDGLADRAQLNDAVADNGQA